jgi:hypothetical protein
LIGEICRDGETAMSTRSTSAAGIGGPESKRNLKAFPRVWLASYVASVLFVVVLPGSYVPAAAETQQHAGAVGETAPMAFPDAVQVLAREQSAAEQYAVILDRLGKKDPALLVQGITRYAEAKADFDGLIEALKTDLIEGRDPGSSTKFTEALRIAAQKRVAFTNFVSEQIVGGDQGARGSLPTMPGLSDLIQALTEAGLSIWREFRGVGKERRAEIRDQLDHLKWRAFGDLAKT